MPSASGRLLVSTPPLVDPNFDRTVVYVLEHDADGAVGVILNRPTDAVPAAALERWSRFLSAPTCLFEGGPVEPGALVALARHRSGDGVGDVVSLDLDEDPDDHPPVDMRLFRGYAGWGPGQLDDEVENGAWIVVPEEDDVFDPEPLGLWRRVLRRQSGRLAWLAEAPDDLLAN